MIVLVSDTSVIIDLERADIVAAVLGLPYEFVVPDALYEAELKPYDGHLLLAQGLRIEALNEAELAHATLARRAHNRLSLPDTFALALAELRGWTLLAGDGLLRAQAQERKVECHGTLWVFDQLEASAMMDFASLASCLERLSLHPRCRLPKREIGIRLDRYRIA